MILNEGCCWYDRVKRTMPFIDQYIQRIFFSGSSAVERRTMSWAVAAKHATASALSTLALLQPRSRCACKQNLTLKPRPQDACSCVWRLSFFFFDESKCLKNVKVLNNRISL
ncbi:hypothetical protein PVAP13_9NG205500 [Panicum virgatum]|uniref:Uncharacterized protein n=1 Tax=Panicum virgatum TaxID=38727 RepID=A0A8T0MHI9_PANVG|nr:hypothetical protein PVAP13_9NG205500 [Panicum virgatum]